MRETIRSLQQIKKVRYIQAFYDQNVYMGTIVYELSEKGILEYYMEQGSRKRLNRTFTKVDSAKMRSFIDELQALAQTADNAFKHTDDCGHKVQFIYEGDHKELFETDIGTMDKEDSLMKRIRYFIADHQPVY